MFLFGGTVCLSTTVRPADWQILFTLNRSQLDKADAVSFFASLRPAASVNR